MLLSISVLVFNKRREKASRALCADENFFPWIDICAIQINKYYNIILYYSIVVVIKKIHSGTSRTSSIRLCPLVLLIRSQIEIRMVPASLFGCIVPLLKYVELSSFLWSDAFDDD